MSSTSLWWRHLVNACEVTAHLIGSLANNLAPKETRAVDKGKHCIPRGISYIPQMKFPSYVPGLLTYLNLANFCRYNGQGRLVALPTVTNRLYDDLSVSHDCHRREVNHIFPTFSHVQK